MIFFLKFSHVFTFWRHDWTKSCNYQKRWQTITNCFSSSDGKLNGFEILISGWAITYGNLREIGSRLQTKTGTVILRPFLKCPAFLYPKKKKKNTFCLEKGVEIYVFQSNVKNSWRGFLDFHIWRTFSNRLLIHFFPPILLRFDTVWYVKKAGHFKSGLIIGVSLLVWKLWPS